MSLHPTPTGWYAVAASRALRVGQIQSRTLFGDDFVLYRTSSGRAVVLAAACPHLGAHLGDGRVEGELLVCPFHAFGFDPAGTCVQTPYGKPPPTARAGALAVRERNGVILAWWDDAGRAPDWEVPALETAGLGSPRFATYRFPGHPQDTTENSVDVGHFTTLHGFEQVRTTSELETNGPHLTAGYAFVHRLGPVGWDAEFTVHCWGLGHSHVEVTIPGAGVRMRLFVYALPIKDGEIELRLGAAAGGNRRAWRMVAPFVRAATLMLLRRDTEQDIPVWSRRRHLPRPALARGDGPIGKYRRWAAQFQPGEALQMVGS